MKSTKIILIAPPFTAGAASGKTRSMRKVMNVIPPIGLAYIAAVLEDNGYSVGIIDATTGISKENLMMSVLKTNPDIIGITSTTPSFEDCMRLTKALRMEFPKALYVIGGAHATALPDETMATGLFDVCVIGEGEFTFLDFINLYEKKKGKITAQELKQIQGIVFFKKGKIVHTLRRPFIDNLDSLPFPAWHLLPPLLAYHPTPASYQRLPQAHVMTSRGCMNHCTFCDRAVFGNIYREHSAEYVLAHIDKLVRDYGVREIKFFDDNFTINPKRLYEICDGMKARKLSWCCLTNVNAVTKEMLVRMKKSGCWQVLFGLESGDEDVLRALLKGNSIAQNEKAVRYAKSAGINVRADFIMGTPGETRKQMQKTIEFAKRLNVDFAHFNKFTPYPGCELHSVLVRQGYKFDFFKNCSQLDHSILLYVPEGMTKEEFKKILDNSYKEYYLRPRYILRQLFSIRSFTDMKRLIDGFFAVSNL